MSAAPDNRDLGAQEACGCQEGGYAATGVLVLFLLDASGLLALDPPLSPGLFWAGSFLAAALIGKGIGLSRAALRLRRLAGEIED